MEALARLEPREVVVDHRWTPAALEEAIQNEKALRHVVVQYYRSAMIEGHHFYSLQEGQKPALSKEGALNLASLFKVKILPGEPKEIFHDDGHYSVRYRVDLVSAATGEVMATGDGFCTTRESKYAYRWAFDRDIPSDVAIGSLVKREFRNNKTGGKFYKYKLPNPDLADCYNVALKISLKRAIVDATLKLPLVSELFTQDLEEPIEARHQPEAQEASSSPLSDAISSPGAPESESPVEDRSTVLGQIMDAMQKLLPKDTPAGKDTNKWYADLQQEVFGERSWKAIQTKVKPSILAEGLKKLQAKVAALQPSPAPEEDVLDHPPPPAAAPSMSAGAATPVSDADLKVYAQQHALDEDLAETLSHYPHGLTRESHDMILTSMHNVVAQRAAQAHPQPELEG